MSYKVGDPVIWFRTRPSPMVRIPAVYLGPNKTRARIAYKDPTGKDCTAFVKYESIDIPRAPLPQTASAVQELRLLACKHGGYAG